MRDRPDSALAAILMEDDKFINEWSLFRQPVFPDLGMILDDYIIQKLTTEREWHDHKLYRYLKQHNLVIDRIYGQLNNDWDGQLNKTQTKTQTLSDEDLRLKVWLQLITNRLSHYTKYHFKSRAEYFASREATIAGHKDLLRRKLTSAKAEPLTLDRAADLTKLEKSVAEEVDSFNRDIETLGLIAKGQKSLCEAVFLPGRGQCKLRWYQSKQKHDEDDCKCCHYGANIKELKLPQPLNYERLLEKVEEYLRQWDKQGGFKGG